MVKNIYKEGLAFLNDKRFCSGKEDVKEYTNEQVEIQSNANDFL